MADDRPLRVCIFASSSPRTPRAYRQAATELGQALAAAGWLCVNGAGRSGCMGALNDACLAAGGRVRGVILQQFLDDGLEHPGITDLTCVDTMRERKRQLGLGVDGYLVLPGGPGTWEEFSEVAVERQIRTHQRPLVVINTDGFYDGFLQQAQRGFDDGLLYGSIDELFAIVPDPPMALSVLAAQLRPPQA